jgi:hypothetical protein
MASIPPQSTDGAPSVRVEIFDTVYNLRGTDPAYITQLAEYVDSKMRAVLSWPRSTSPTSTTCSCKKLPAAPRITPSAPRPWPASSTKSSTRPAAPAS